MISRSKFQHRKQSTMLSRRRIFHQLAQALPCSTLPLREVNLLIQKTVEKSSIQRRSHRLLIKPRPQTTLASEREGKGKLEPAHHWWDCSLLCGGNVRLEILWKENRSLLLSKHLVARCADVERMVLNVEDHFAFAVEKKVQDRMADYFALGGKG